MQAYFTIMMETAMLMNDPAFPMFNLINPTCRSNVLKFACKTAYPRCEKLGNAKDKDGKLPLDYAVENSASLEHIQVLVLALPAGLDEVRSRKTSFRVGQVVTGFSS